MNYYTHHIGDYAEATAHLTFVEDAAYSRLMRKYYASEKPLPSDIKAVQRLICARSDEEKEAVETVLNEFFVLESDGWHNHRCDAEIEKYKDKQRKASGSARARWNKQQAQCERNANAMRTQSECNANQEPITNNQEPITPLPPFEAPAENEKPTPTPAATLSIELRKHGVQCQPADPRVIALAEQGVDIETVKAACEQAAQSKPGERIGIGYVVKILERWAVEAKKINVKGAEKKRAPPDSWWTSDAGIDRKGRELGLMPMPMESYPDYKSRIFEEIRKREAA